MKIQKIDLLQHNTLALTGQSGQKASLYIFVFLFFVGCFFLTNSGVDTSEGVYHYRVAEQIIRHGQLGFDQNQVGIFTLAPNGRTYASHEIGNTLFLLPTASINVFLSHILSGRIKPELLAQVQGFITSFHAGVISATTATIFFALLNKHFIKDARKSFISTLALVGTTFFWTYSRNLFDGVLCSALLMSSFLCLLNFQSKGRKVWLVSCFTLLGFGLITRLSMIVPIVGTFVFLLLSERGFQWRNILLSLSTLIPFFIWQGWYNFLRTGIFYKSPVQMPQYYGSNALDGDLVQGLIGLLFSPGKSIFIYAPLLIISVLASLKFSQKFSRESVYIAVISILWFALHAKLKSWYGAAGWGPRHFITILPILFLPAATYLNAMLENAKLRLIPWILGGAGFTLALSSMISNWHFRMMYSFERGIDGEKFIWGFFDAQPLDLVIGTFENCLRMISHGVPITLKDTYSPANEYASSTLNFWWNSLLYAGIPSPVVLLLVLPLLVLIVVSGNKIVQATKD
jgi:hypothetical protein